ncbi:MAG: aspartate/glutamate racemase family protein [Methylocystaceae bacterium]|nr:aspartate/glutamate racemase family protein [Methylocystaceae bacterium]
MQILIVNPNTTETMTRKIEAAARAIAHPTTQIIATNPSDGPVSIEGYYDEAFSVPGLLQEIIKGEAQKVSAHIIACFDDTGLEACRSMAQAPVIGIGEAAFHFATFLAHKFSVVTTLSRSIAAIENNILKYGLSSRCSSVRAAEIPVLALEEASPKAIDQISEVIEHCITHDRAEAIVLGCAGMTDLQLILSKRHNIPILDGVSCAVKMAESFGALGYKTSKNSAYSQPYQKEYKGMFKDSSPQTL